MMILSRYDDMSPDIQLRVGELMESGIPMWRAEEAIRKANERAAEKGHMIDDRDMAPIGELEEILGCKFQIETQISLSKVLVQLDPDAHMPTYAHDTDAGMDLYAMNRCVIPPHGSAVFDTGVHVAIPEGFCGLIVSKSGLNINHGLTSDGLIDSGYTGSIRVKLYNHTSHTKIIENGQKISQMVILPYLHTELVLTPKLPDNSLRGNNGFGSTGDF